MQERDLQKKIAAPMLPARILHRQRLVTYLEEAVGQVQKRDGTQAHYQLVSLWAPAGYGKTTLLADFARSTSLPCCWYFLEQEDSNWAIFIRTLLKSLQSLFPSLGELEPLLTNLLCEEVTAPAKSYQPALDALGQALTEVARQDFAIFLCNYGAAYASLTQLLHHLLKRLPPSATLVIESRTALDPSFAPLFAQRQICAVNKALLRFTAREIVELARLQGLNRLSEEEAEQLARDFDGWITGILLATRLGEQAVPDLGELGIPEQMKPLYQQRIIAEQRRAHLTSYLINDVFSHEPEIKSFIQLACIFQEMHPEICDALLETDKAREWLTYMEQQGLFVTSHLDHGQRFYTCLPVVRSLFLEQFRQSDPERFYALHWRAARLWQDRKNYEQAMYHALEAQAYELAGEILFTYARLQLQQGQIDGIMRWLNALPASLLEQHPQLLTIRAHVLLEEGQHREALSLLERALTLLSGVEYTPASSKKATFLAEIYLLRSKALFQEGEYTQALQLCQQVLLHLPEHEDELRAAAEMRLGICACLQGDVATGITYLQQALRTWSHQPSLNLAIAVHSALANTYYLVNKLDLAEHHLLCAISYCEQARNIRGIINNRILQGLILGRRGALAEAEAVLQQALVMARAAPGYHRGEAYALGNLGSLALVQGHSRQALAYCQEALVLACQYGNRSLCNSIYSTMALAYLFLGDQTSARHFVEAIRVGERSSAQGGYEWSWSRLTAGLVYLYQGCYEQAYTSLAETVALLRKADLRQEQLLATLRLAACQLARQHVGEAVELLEEVGRLLEEGETDKLLVLGEIERLAELRTLIEREPELAHLRTLLAIEKAPEQNASATQGGVTGGSVEEPGARLKILAFGEPMVLVDDQPIKNWRRMSAMELFFFLLNSDQPLSREQVIAALWPEDCEQVDKAFHMALYYLRKALGKTCVVFSVDGYSLNLATCYGGSIWYDVKEFQGRWSEARQALARGEEENAQQALLRMVELYRGDYGRPFYSDWCRQRRDELRTAYLEALCQLAQIAWNHQDMEACMYYWRKALAVDNCMEEAHYGIMLCYMAQGKRSAALRQYQLCKKILQQELCVEPGSLLQELYRRLSSTAESAQMRQMAPGKLSGFSGFLQSQAGDNTDKVSIHRTPAQAERKMEREWREEEQYAPKRGKGQ
jgi:ATP/maltotriose-dependent transcriptional regulator MalT/DNA-binding SARP family transcriptional activator